jgi:hypothetical protein
VNTAAIRGSCCCGAISFELLAPPVMMGTCHCSRCRKAGASTFVIVKRESFRLLRGAEAIARLAPEPPFKYARTFCRLCGTSLGEVGSEQDSFPIAAHCFDDDPIVRNRFHEFVSAKPAWYDINDDAKQFSHHPTR